MQHFAQQAMKGKFEEIPPLAKHGVEVFCSPFETAPIKRQREAHIAFMVRHMQMRE